MRGKALLLALVWFLFEAAMLSAQQPTSSAPKLIYRCSGHCRGVWWDDYRHRPLRLQGYTTAGPIGGGERIGYSTLGPFLEAFDDAGNRTETLGEWGGGTNVELDFFFVDGGNKLVVVSTDGGDSCATTVVYLHDLQWPPTQNEILLEPTEVMCNGEVVRAEHPEVMHLPTVGMVIPSEDGSLLANSFPTGSGGTGRTQLIDLAARKVVAETNGTLIGRAGPRAFYVVEPLYTERYHHVRDQALKEFSLDGAKVVGRAGSSERVVRGSGGQLILGGTIHKVDTGQPLYGKPEKQVLEDEFKPGLKASAQGAQSPPFPCKVLNMLNAWQEPSGELVVAVEETCEGKTDYALYRLPKPSS